jgi:hypothetical protein
MRPSAGAHAAFYRHLGWNALSPLAGESGSGAPEDSGEGEEGMNLDGLELAAKQAHWINVMSEDVLAMCSVVRAAQLATKPARSIYEREQHAKHMAALRQALAAVEQPNSIHQAPPLDERSTGA